jgi:hypothetical protein
MSKPTKSREGLLTEIWEKTAAAAVLALSADAPSAATITACRQFLADNGISLDTLPQLKLKAARSGSALGDLGPLPVFAPDPEDTNTEAPAPPPTVRRSETIAWHRDDADDPEKQR